MTNEPASGKKKAKKKGRRSKKMKAEITSRNTPSLDYEAGPMAAEMVRVTDLTPHPRNYRDHPADQLEHLKASIKEFGFYRNVVVGRGGVLLAGHGVVKAATEMGIEEVPVVRVDLDPDSPAALKLLAADNTIANLAEVDDRALTELLKEIGDEADLLGTGFDDKMLAALVMVTRPESEIKDFDAAAEWVGMPEYGTDEETYKLVLSFKSEAERDALCEKLELVIAKKYGLTWSARWPPQKREELSSVRFEA